MGKFLLSNLLKNKIKNIEAELGEILGTPILGRNLLVYLTVTYSADKIS